MVRVWAAGRVVAVARAARAAAVAALVGSAPPAGARERGFGCGECDARASLRAQQRRRQCAGARWAERRRHASGEPEAWRSACEPVLHRRPE